MIISDEIRSELKLSDPIGAILRVKEHRKNDNSICTGDSGALLLHRVVDGWLYKCFRCGEKGKILSDGATPSNVLEYKKRNVEPNYGAVERVGLPSDSIPATWDNVDLEAKKWLLKYRITRKNIVNHNIGWSPGYKRLIFPVKSTALLDRSIEWGSLIGWIGRSPYEVSSKTPKWLKKKSKNVTNFFYHIIGDNQNVIIVEDVISAIRVSDVTKSTVIALMGTAFPVELMLKLKDFNVKVWLDKDALVKSVEYWKKMCSMGITCKYIYTPLDPKEYSNDGIRLHADWRNNEFRN